MERLQMLKGPKDGDQPVATCTREEAKHESEVKAEDKKYEGQGTRSQPLSSSAWRSSEPSRLDLIWAV